MRNIGPNLLQLSCAQSLAPLAYPVTSQKLEPKNKNAATRKYNVSGCVPCQYGFVGALCFL